MSLRRFATLSVAVCLAAAARSYTPVHADPLTTTRLHWVTDGAVQAAAVLGDSVYIAGTFTRVAPSSGAVGSLYPLSTASGAYLPGMARPEGEVYDVEPDGAGGYYVAGNFESFGGVARAGLARIRPDGDLDAVFVPPDSSRPVSSAVRGATAVFAIDREGVSAVDAVTGASLWRASDVRAGKVVVSGTAAIAFGAQFNGTPVVVAYDQTSGAKLWQTTVPFASFGDAVVVGPRLILSTGALTALSIATGAIDATWTPPTTPGWINALAAVGSTLYIGGNFSTFGGAARANLAAVDLNTAQLAPWAPPADGEVMDLLDSGAGLYVAGEFTTLAGGARASLGLVDAGGVLQSWQPATHSQRVRTVAPGPAGVLIAGGAPALTGSVARPGTAAFSLSNDSLLPWAPAIPGGVPSMLASGERVLVNTFDASSAVLEARDPVSGAVVWSKSQLAAGLAAAGAVFGTDASVTPSRLVKLDPTTGAVDANWTPPLTSAFAPVAADGSHVVFASGNWFVEVDADTGAIGPMREALPGCSYGGQHSCQASIWRGAMDGGTIYLGLRYFSGGSGLLESPRVIGVDRRSGRRTVFDIGQNFGSLSALATADGQVLHAMFQPPLLFLGLSDAEGRGREWAAHLALRGQPNAAVLFTVTPTDIVVSGVQRSTFDPVQGVAVLPRQPPASPHALTWSTLGNRLTLRWTPPASAPAGYLLEAGSAPGLADLALIPLGAVTEFTANAPTGTFFVRVRAAGTSGDAAIATNEVAVTVGCTAPPQPPTDLVARLEGGLVTLRWSPPAAELTGFQLEAGTVAGSSNIATVPLGQDVVEFSAAAPPGVYFVRTRAVNGCGPSGPSTEVFFRVGAPDALPAAPDGLTQGTTGGVALTWNAVPGAIGYLVEAGSWPRQTNLARVQVASPQLMAPGVTGRFHVRVRAISTAGLGPPGPELLIQPGFP